MLFWMKKKPGFRTEPKPGFLVINFMISNFTPTFSYIQTGKCRPFFWTILRNGRYSPYCRRQRLGLWKGWYPAASPSICLFYDLYNIHGGLRRYASWTALRNGLCWGMPLLPFPQHQTCPASGFLCILSLFQFHLCQAVVGNIAFK